MVFDFIKKIIKFAPKESEVENHDTLGKEIHCLKCNEVTSGYCCNTCFRWYCKKHVKNHHCIYSRKRYGEKCTYCKKKYTESGGFYCMYCAKWYCELHHSPKAHKCKHPVHRKK